MLPIAYKVVYENVLGGLTPATYMGRQSCYYPDQWTRPHENNGPLACFRTLEQAMEWRRVRGDSVLRVYECEYVPAPLQHCVWVYYYQGGTSRFVSLPEDTVLAWSVKLLRRVA